ncbi:MAG TPA: hypothetical protein VLD59_20870 [Steroidobacteraceae bacterium]|nr:hypothetical protein [Steroidobacteraceae bacterium]
MTDILLAIGFTVSAALLVALFIGSWRGSTRARTSLALAALVWFGAVVLLGETGVLAANPLGIVGIGALVLAPIVILAYLAGRVPLLRQVLLQTPVPIFVLVHVGRILGIGFLVLHAQGRLAAPFAPVAGWGDIFIALTAVPVALLLASRPGVASRNLALAWNTLGMIDLVVAVGLGVTSAPDSPLQVFTQAPGTAVMSGLPMLLVPVFLVPLYFLSHMAIFHRLLHSRAMNHHAQVRAA